MFAFYLLLWYDEVKPLLSATLRISFCSVKASIRLLRRTKEEICRQHAFHNVACIIENKRRKDKVTAYGIW